ncbi:hypothetical protein ACPDHJ_15960 [Myroides sp. C8-3]|uniref:hypothetical protein n=1 Tax=Myroides sp. C8-3 TaxID=3400533 RepID=UPI003D2F96DC
MRKSFLLIAFLLLTNLTFAQDFDFKLIDKLTKISFVSIDELMIEGYGFKKLEKDSEERKRTYARYYDGDFNNTIIISVLNPKDTPNVLDISLAKNYDIRKIKDELLKLDYEYNGSNEYGFVIYKNEKTAFLISKEPNNVGATQIMVITEW